MRIVFTSIDQPVPPTVLPSWSGWGITFPMNCGGKIIPFPPLRHFEIFERHSPNRFTLRRRTAVSFLERRDGTVLECLVSRKDFHRVRRQHWYANKNGKRASYAVAWIDGAQVQMHKHLCPNWAQVNHQNGNGLDNRRENLRGHRSRLIDRNYSGDRRQRHCPSSWVDNSSRPRY
jgi:hypothetical protein